MDNNKTMMTNEVLGAKLDAVGQRVEKVELKVDNLGTAYVPHDIFELRLKELETKIVGFNLELKNIWLKLQESTRRSKIQAWITGTTSAGAGIILALLVEFYLSHVGK